MSYIKQKARFKNVVGIVFLVFFKPNDFLGSCRRRKCPEAWMLGSPKAEEAILHGAGVTAQACAGDTW